MTARDSSMVRNTQSTSIPLIVGTTGHRDLFAEDLPRIRELIREVLRSLQQKYPHTPLVILSPLVEGADQLIAKVALEEGPQTRLAVVLPWSEEISKAQWPRGGDSADFEELLNRADRIITMPVNEDARNLHALETAEFQQHQYSLVGKYIARHSQLLIAIWDGEGQESSGTARVVNWQRDGAPAPFTAHLGELDVVEGAPICHIKVRRAKRSEGTVPVIPTATWLYPELSSESSSKEEIHRTWSNIDRFNQDIRELQQTSPQMFITSRSWVVSDEVTNRLPAELRELLEFYAAADAVALSFQSRVKRLVRNLFVIGPLALICLEVYAHLWSQWPALAAYLLLLGLGYGMFLRARRADLQGRYLDVRAMAEALRVQFFWRWAGLQDCAAEHYLRHLRGELGWIRQASRTAFLLTSEDRAVPSESAAAIVPGSEESLRGVLNHWVLDQARFFAKKAPVNEHLESRCERITKWSFRAAMVIAVIELIVHRQTDHANHLLIVLTFFGLVAAALSEEIADYHNFGILARQYEWMKNLFSTAAGKLVSLIAGGNAKKSQVLLHDLGLEALNENADWLVQRRRKPVVLPRG